MPTLAERFPAFASADFRRLFANGFFTTGARWAQVLARGWLVHDLTDGSSTAVGWVTFASFLPFILVGPFVGTLADRLDRRMVLMAATLAGVIGAAALAVVTLTEVVTPLQVGLLAFFTGAAQASTVPTRQALIANAVPSTHLLNAVALGGISQHGSRVVGPLFGAAFLQRFGPGSVFVFATVLLMFAFVEVIRLSPHRPAGADQPDQAGGSEKVGLLAGVARVGHDLADAGRYVRADVRLATVIGLVAVHCSFTMAFDALLPTLSERVGGSSGLYGSILIGLGAGALVGTIGVSQLGEGPGRGRAFWATGTGSGAAMLVLGWAPNPTVVVIGGVLAGLTQASYMTLSATLIQRVVADKFRGRVMSLYIMIAAGHMAFMNLGFGWVADHADVRALLIGPGVVWVAVFLVAAVASSETRSVIATGRFTRTQVGLLAA